MSEHDYQINGVGCARWSDISPESHFSVLDDQREVISDLLIYGHVTCFLAF